MKDTRAIKICAMAGAIFLFPWALSAQSNTFTWHNQTAIPVFFEIPGYEFPDIHKAHIRIESSGGAHHGLTADTQFFITYPDGTSDFLASVVPAGTEYHLSNKNIDFHTDVNPPYGYTVHFVQTAEGAYELTISKNADLPSGFDYASYDPRASGNQYGEFDKNETWCLIITHLDSAGNQVLAAGSVNKDFKNIDLASSCYARVFGQAGYWVDKTEVNTLIRLPQLPPSPSDGVTKLEITVNTGAFIPGILFDLTYPRDITTTTIGNASEYKRTAGISCDVTAYTEDIGLDDGRRVRVEKANTGIPAADAGKYIITIEQKENLPSRYLGQYNQEYLELKIRNIGSINTIRIQLKTLNGADDNSSVFAETIALVKPSPAVIIKPANIYSKTPVSMQKQRRFGFSQKIVDFDTALGTVSAFSWRLDDVFNPALPVTQYTSTAQNPADYQSLSNLHPYKITLLDTENIDVASLGLPSSGTPPGPFWSFSNVTGDEINIAPAAFDKIYFPRFYPVPYSSAPPVIDGQIDRRSLTETDPTFAVDVGWYNAYRQTYGGGTEPAPAHVTVQTLRGTAADPNLYICYQVRNDPTFDDDDAIVIGIRPFLDTANPASSDSYKVEPQLNDLVLLIFPLTHSGAHGDATPRHMEIWRYNAANAWEKAGEVDHSSVLAGITAAVSSFDMTVSSDKAWDVEIKLPLSLTVGSTPVTIGQDFLFYTNVIRVSTIIADHPLAVQFAWPRLTQSVISGNLSPESIIAGAWGWGTRNDNIDYFGIWLEAKNITVTHNPAGPYADNQFVINNSNTFHAKVYNKTMKDTGGAQPVPQTAENVRVRFRIANWGAAGPGDWIDLPYPVTDLQQAWTSPVHSIPPAADANANGVYEEDEYGFYDFSKVWAIDAAGSNVPPNVQTIKHQCIMVEIDSLSDTNIIARSSYRNMDYKDTASEFSDKAVIGSKGYRPPPAGDVMQKFLLQTAAYTWKQKEKGHERRITAGAPKMSAPSAAPPSSDDVESYIIWTAHAYLFNGSQITINGHGYRTAEHAGSFGYVISHDGDVVTWSYDVKNAHHAAHDHYLLDIPSGTSSHIAIRIKPVELTPLSLSLHGGAASPLANFTNAYSTGFCAGLDVGYALTPCWSLILNAGFNYLAGMSVPATSIVNIGLDVRFTLPFTQLFYGYVQAGPAVFLQDFSAFSAGYSGGLGVGLELPPRLRLELGADYHSTWNQQNWFLQTRLGVIFRL